MNRLDMTDFLQWLEHVDVLGTSWNLVACSLEAQTDNLYGLFWSWPRKMFALIDQSAVTWMELDGDTERRGHLNFNFEMFHGHPQFPLRFVDPVVRSMTAAIRCQIKAAKIVFHRFPVIFVPLIVASYSTIPVDCFRKDSSDGSCAAPSRRQASPQFIPTSIVVYMISRHESIELCTILSIYIFVPLEYIKII